MILFKRLFTLLLLFTGSTALFGCTPDEEPNKNENQPIDQQQDTSEDEEINDTEELVLSHTDWDFKEYYQNHKDDLSLLEDQRFTITGMQSGYRDRYGEQTNTHYMSFLSRVVCVFPEGEEATIPLHSENLRVSVSGVFHAADASLESITLSECTFIEQVTTPKYTVTVDEFSALEPEDVLSEVVEITGVVSNVIDSLDKFYYHLEASEYEEGLMFHSNTINTLQNYGQYEEIHEGNTVTFKAVVYSANNEAGYILFIFDVVD